MPQGNSLMLYFVIVCLNNNDCQEINQSMQNKNYTLERIFTLTISYNHMSQSVWYSASVKADRYTEAWLLKRRVQCLKAKRPCRQMKSKSIVHVRSGLKLERNGGFKPTSQLSKIGRTATARPVLHRIRQKSCGDPPIEPPSGTRPVVIRQI